MAMLLSVATELCLRVRSKGNYLDDVDPSLFSQVKGLVIDRWNRRSGEKI